MRKLGCHGVLPVAGDGKGRMSWCILSMQRLEVGKAGCHSVRTSCLEAGGGKGRILSRGWRWERQDVIVYCMSKLRGWRLDRQDVMVYVLPEAGDGKGRMSWPR